MNKKIIAIAIATAMAAPVAMADVKVGGQIGAALTQISKEGADAGATGNADAADKAVRGFSDNGLSKIEFSGNEGDASFKVGIDIRSIMGGKGAGATLNGRDFWIGHKLGGGSFKFGRLPAALAGLEGDKYNATFLELRRTAAVTATDANYTDTYNKTPVLEYSMKAGGAAIKIQYDPSDNAKAHVAEGHMGIGVKGKAGPVGYFVGYNTGNGNEGGTNQKETNMKAGASMKFGAANVTLFLMNSDDNGTKTASQTVFADIGMGNGMSLGVAYGQQSEGVPKKDTFMRLAVNKSLSKNSAIFGGATSKKDDSTGNTTTTYGAGMRIKF